MIHDCVFWCPYEKYHWHHEKPVETADRGGLRIYEAHIGIAQEKQDIGTYTEFTNYTLPLIKQAGYNAIQLMAIHEHSLYESYGYHVTGFFAVCSRFGSPNDFKHLVNQAHSMGIKVIIDLVHSHASLNLNDGIANLDGTDCCYSHAGERGLHQAWDSMVFDYGKYEVKRFLLSNIAWWMNEYHVDGFRFDAVKSMMYVNHGIDKKFDSLGDYFGVDTDLDGIVQLMLSNYLIHSINPDAITIAEDYSGQPTLCSPIDDGGIGFDYKLGVSTPHMWLDLVKHVPDQDWNINKIVNCLINRRQNEKTIAFCESHDQAILKGNKTLASWLLGDDIYAKRYDDLTDKVGRGLALLKMIRLLTFSLGGEGYLNFIGNEFGHPDWVDLSDHNHSNRKWHLKYDPNLRFS